MRKRAAIEHADRQPLAELLVELQATGDAEVLLAITDRMKGDVYRWAYRLVRDEQKADDLRQEVFKAFVDGYETIKNPGCLRIWFYRTTRNLRRKVTLNQREILLPNPDLEELLNTQSEGENPRDILLSAERHAELLQALSDVLAGLPEYLRACIKLRFFEALSLDETAERLRLSPKRVTEYTSKALAKLSKNKSLKRWL